MIILDLGRPKCKHQGPYERPKGSMEEAGDESRCEDGYDVGFKNTGRDHEPKNAPLSCKMHGNGFSPLERAVLIPTWRN